MALTQTTNDVSRLEDSYKGYNGVSLTNFAATTEPQIALGSVIEIGGSILKAAANESITGWAGIGDGNDVYIYVDTAGAASFSTTAPTWDTSKQGYYNGTDRAVAGVYKTDATTWDDKYIIKNINSILNTKELGTGLTLIKMPLYHVQHKTAGDGGTSTANTWNLRPLNTEVTTEIPSASLASNQITLPAGKYYIQAWSSGWATGNYNQIRFRNITDAATEVIGGTVPAGTAGANCPMYGRFEIAGSKTFEIHHYVQSTRATTGLGYDANSGEDNIYADVLIWKIG